MLIVMNYKWRYVFVHTQQVCVATLWPNQAINQVGSQKKRYLYKASKKKKCPMSFSQEAICVLCQNKEIDAEKNQTWIQLSKIQHKREVEGIPGMMWREIPGQQLGSRLTGNAVQTGIEQRPQVNFSKKNLKEYQNCLDIFEKRSM